MKKKMWLLLPMIGIVFFAAWLVPGDPVHIPPSNQRIGQADLGYQYIITGDYVKSGLPLNLFRLGFKKDKEKWLLRDGANETIPYDLTAVKADNGENIVVPNCLQCHAQVFNDSLIIGLGNASGDFTAGSKMDSPVLRKLLNSYLAVNKKKQEAAQEFLTVYQRIGDKIVTDTRGVNPADRLAALLIAHRDPQTLVWKDEPSVELPSQVIPSDVPAWWLLKKKNAMFYNGFGRGDFGRFLMGSVLITISDTIHAREVDSHMPDVLAYINSLTAPKYPFPINKDLANEGRLIFNETCSKCHGTYGEHGQYPNLLIPQETIQTDSMLNASNYQNSNMVSWFNNSWFGQGDHPGKLVPFNGYIAPPLDGVWITAPYLHNGSVPTIDALLDSKKRPAYWTRNFEKTEYDYEKLGWHYEEKESAPNKKIYNTQLPGYSNKGHYFGDQLSDQERRAVIEYLKTL